MHLLHMKHDQVIYGNIFVSQNTNYWKEKQLSFTWSKSQLHEYDSVQCFHEQVVLQEKQHQDKDYNDQIYKNHIDDKVHQAQW